jgi:hypothetical protein
MAACCCCELPSALLLPATGPTAALKSTDASLPLAAGSREEARPAAPGGWALIMPSAAALTNVGLCMAAAP